MLEADGKKVKWLVAQSGVSNDAMQQGAQITTLTGELRQIPEVLEGNQAHKGPNLVFVANILGEEPNFPRRVMGYTDLDQVSFGAGPSPRFLQMFEERWRNRATNEAGKVNAWLGWYEMASPGGFIPLHPRFLLLHRGHEAFLLDRGIGPYACKARGLWTLTGTTVEVVWEDETPNQSWTMATTFVRKACHEGHAHHAQHRRADAGSADPAGPGAARHARRLARGVARRRAAGAAFAPAWPLGRRPGRQRPATPPATSGPSRSPRRSSPRMGPA